MDSDLIADPELWGIGVVIALACLYVFSLRFRAICLWLRTNWIVSQRRKREKKAKQKNPDGRAGVFPVVLFGQTETKYDANLALCSHGRNDFVETLPGKSKWHNSWPARKLVRAIHIYQTNWWRRRAARCYIKQKIRFLGEKRKIHDLTHSNHPWMQMYFAPYRLSIAGGRYTPTPDLQHSDFYAKDIWFRVPSDDLAEEKFTKVHTALSHAWEGPIGIEYHKGAVRVHAIKRLPTQHWTPLPGPVTDQFILGKDRLNPGNVISFPIKKMAFRSQVMLLGQIGSGKTNHVRLWLKQLGTMVRAPVEEDEKEVAHVHFIDPTGAVGFDPDVYQGIQFATKPEQILSTLQGVEEIYEKRAHAMEELKLQQWPWALRVVVFDELAQLIGHPAMPKKLADQLVDRSNKYRKYGIFLMFATQRARAIDGIPTGLTANCGFRLCGRVDERATATDFFTCDMERFRKGMAPIDLVQGQFVMKQPWGSDFIYGQTDLAEESTVA